jgi:hypothetical protein
MPTMNPKMTVTRPDGSTLEVCLEPTNDESAEARLEPETGLRLLVTTSDVWIVADDAYPPGLKFPVNILPAIWGLEKDTPVIDVLAELSRCGRPPHYKLKSGDLLTNDQGWTKCEFQL